MTDKSKRETTTAGVPLHVYLRQAAEQVPDLTNVKIAQALGYERPNVIAMILNGTMKLPVNKVAAIAKVLCVDPIALLRRVLNEYDPSLWTTFESVLGKQLLSDNEAKLIDFVRRHLGNEDVDIAGEERTAVRLGAMLIERLDLHLRAALAERRGEPVRISKAAMANKAMLTLLDRQAAERQALRKSLNRS